MQEDTQQTDETEETTDDQSAEEPKTSGYIERTILHHLAGDAYEPYRPATVGDVLDDVAAVIERGDYANVGPPTAASGTVRKSTIRRAFAQLREKGLVQRVGELDESQLRAWKFDLGPADGDPDDPGSYERRSGDARVTDWILTDAGRAEVERLDARYAAELDELAARYGRPRGETTDRIET
ncbi:hypothetical protein BRC65_06085 [Halobacteriales archaeon QH_2_65_14]|nr:MAG: hypothetical protein BRC65_06085 [Halobacteriales archaeon QH_2_65_14]